MIKSFLILAFECLVFDAVKKSPSHTDIIKEQRNCLSSWMRRMRRGGGEHDEDEEGRGVCVCVRVKQFIHKETTRQICIAILAFCCLSSVALACSAFLRLVS